MATLERQFETARARLAGPPGTVHLLGAGGVGMAGLARLLSARGFRASGCDLARNRLTDWLASKGVPVALGHAPAHARGQAWMIHSAAVPSDHPELLAACATGAAVTCRGAVLPALLEGRGAIAVAGTHGKTTVTNMIAQVLLGAGREPGYAVGGECEALDGVADPGAGRYRVAEADESDGTLRLYAPETAVVTNIDYDHMEHFRDEAEFVSVFEHFASRTRGVLFYGADDARAAALGRARAGSVGVGLGEGAALRAVELSARPFGTAFTVVREGVRLGRVELPVPGEHNVRNALAALGVALDCGCSFEEAARALAGYRRARRRLERVWERDGTVIFSDYAHHPTEIRALIRSVAGLPRRRLVALFQPHRYTRTRALGAAFPGAFEGVEELLLLPVYPASEAPLEGGRSEDLARHFSQAGWTGVGCAASMADARAWLRATVRAGDLVLIVGAGDIEQLAEDVRGGRILP